MNKEELKNIISGKFEQLPIDDTAQMLTLQAAPEQLLELVAYLKNESQLQFDYLFNLTCIDWISHLTMVYHLNSKKYNHDLVLKVNLDDNQPSVETLSHIWFGAELLEREVYELFGVDFKNHPDLRLLILPDGWEGRNPLRKKFEDPINMIKL